MTSSVVDNVAKSELRISESKNNSEY